MHVRKYRYLILRKKYFYFTRTQRDAIAIIQKYAIARTFAMQAENTMSTQSSTRIRVLVRRNHRNVI